VPGLPSRLEGERAAVVVQALPLGLVLGIVAFMVEREGAFALTVWTPLALLVLGIVATFALSARPLLATASRTNVAAVACLAGFTVWSFATIAWAAVRSDAWDGSNRTLLYLLVFALLATWPTRARAVWPVVLAAGVVFAAEGVYTVERAVHATDPTQYLIGSRLSEPLGYPNATAALFMTMAWLMVGLASRPWVPAPARGLATGLAGLYAVLNLLGESRGSVFTLPLVAIAYFVLVPGRLRSTVVLGLVALALLPLIHPVTQVYGGDADRISEELRHALGLGLVWSVVLAGAGWLAASVDNRLRLPPRATRMAGAAVVAAAVIGLAGAAVVTKPWYHVGPAWHSFKYQAVPTGTATHFGSLGSNRYDFWRVGLIEFKHHPLLGIGPNNFLVPYLEQRRSGEEPIFPHSLLIGLLSQTGLIGTALFASFLSLTVIGVLRIPRGRERELAGILLAGASVWLLHGLVDWLWEMPVLSVLGMALLGTACGLAPRRAEAAAPAPANPPSRARRLAPAVAVAALAIIAAATLAPPWLAARQVQRAVRAWPNDPSTALTRLGDAHDLDPLASQADVLAGAMAGRLHRYELMRARYQAAVDRSPDDWYANLELGIANSLTGHPTAAGSALERAARLNPGEPITRRVLNTFSSGRPIDSDAVDRAFQNQRD
jgi:hypothetical protein